MAGVLQGNAHTTPLSRAEFQASQESRCALAAQYGLNQKTVAKWCTRTVTTDAPMGPKAPRSTVLTPGEEETVVEFRRRTLPPPDDVLGCLRDTIPSLSRSALHRRLQRHGISRLPATVPSKIDTVPTDNGMAFAALPKNRTGSSRRFPGPHVFDRVRIEHRLTKP